MYKLRHSAPLTLQGSAPQATALLQKITTILPTHQVHTSTTLAEEMKKESTSGPATPPDQIHSEKQVKYGVNTPRSAGEFATEAGHAAKGVVDSVKDTIKVTATAIKRSLGMSKGKPLSSSEIHGGAGKMQHAPPPVGKDLPAGGAAKSRAHAEAKYQEIRDTEKPHFPHGKQSVNEMYPDMREAAKLQNQGGEGGENLKKEREDDSDKQQLNKTMHDLGP